MNELHLRETAALELASPMTLPQQDAGIPPLSPEISIHPARDIKSWLELYAADGIIYFCVWAQLRTEARYDLYIGCTCAKPHHAARSASETVRFFAGKNRR